ncbi:MAG TPA: hypothetical protein VJT83_01375 [Chitinophagaceae bacterium]|nr:hypothetical protein [Chitinophagaceae bacterium]
MQSQEEDKIPVFKKWSHWYVLLIVYLVALIVFFHFFTQYFS